MNEWMSDDCLFALGAPLTSLSKRTEIRYDNIRRGIRLIGRSAGGPGLLTAVSMIGSIVTQRDVMSFIMMYATCRSLRTV